jgi:hypothetical protein
MIFFFLAGSKTKIAKEISASQIKIESSYTGLHLEFPITKDQFYNLVDSFKMNKVIYIVNNS